MLPTMPRCASRSMKISASDAVLEECDPGLARIAADDQVSGQRQFAKRRMRTLRTRPIAHERRDHRRTAVAHEGQREPLDGHEPRDHSDIVHDLEREGRAHARDEEGAEPVAREPRRLEHAPEQQQVERERHRHADEAGLLREHGEDEVGVARRQVAELRLASLHEAAAHEPARAHRDLRLDLLVAGAARVERGVEEGVDARLLVVLEHRPGEPGREHERRGEHRAPPASAGPRETPPPGTAAPGRPPSRGRARARSAAPAGPPPRPAAPRRAGRATPGGTRRTPWPRTRRPRA